MSYLINPKPTRLKDKRLKYVTIDDDERQLKVAARKDVVYSGIDNDFEEFLIDVGQDIMSNDYGMDFIITSGREGKHAKGSKHYSGQAIDLRIDRNFHDNPTESPIFKYFSTGKGKEFIEKHNIWMHPNPAHGSAPHIHLEMALGKSSSIPDTSLPEAVSAINLATAPGLEDIATSMSYDAANMENEVATKANETSKSEAKNILTQAQQFKNDAVKKVLSQDLFVEQAKEEAPPALPNQTDITTIDQSFVQQGLSGLNGSGLGISEEFIQ